MLTVQKAPVTLCVCLGEEWRIQWPKYAAAADLVELRIDLMFPEGATTLEVTEALAPLLHDNNSKIVLTCRTGATSQEARLDLFLALLPFMPAYIDLEHDTPKNFSEPLYTAVQSLRATTPATATQIPTGTTCNRATTTCNPASTTHSPANTICNPANTTQIIASYHNVDATPDTSQLCAIADHALLKGADLVKIVTCCRHPEDEERLLSLYRVPRFTNRIIAFSLGPYALTSRLHAVASGAPILFVAPDEGPTTSPGQPRFSKFKAHLANVLCGITS